MDTNADLNLSLHKFDREEHYYLAGLMQKWKDPGFAGVDVR